MSIHKLYEITVEEFSISILATKTIKHENNTNNAFKARNTNKTLFNLSVV